MRGEVGKGFGRGLERVGEPPIQAKQMDVGDRIATQRLAADIGLPSKGTPISCSAMCTANELEPGAKYKVSM
jgi:hypothetical protein